MTTTPRLTSIPPCCPRLHRPLTDTRPCRRARLSLSLSASLPLSICRWRAPRFLPTGGISNSSGGGGVSVTAGWERLRRDTRRIVPSFSPPTHTLTNTGIYYADAICGFAEHLSNLPLCDPVRYGEVRSLLCFRPVCVFHFPGRWHAPVSPLSGLLEGADAFSTPFLSLSRYFILPSSVWNSGVKPEPKLC